MCENLDFVAVGIFDKDRASVDRIDGDRTAKHLTVGSFGECLERFRDVVDEEREVNDAARFDLVVALWVVSELNLRLEVVAAGASSTPRSSSFVIAIAS